MAYNPFCLSSYLSFRYLVRDGEPWKPGLCPQLPHLDADEQLPVGTAEQVLARLDGLVPRDRGTGILLSGGIDSAILASYLPQGTRAYTIRFVAEGAIDESAAARRYAEALGLELTVVEVAWQDYERFVDPLMHAKRAPLHAIEPALHKAARTAKADGIERLIVGNGADSTFGGLDKLLSRDWTCDEFARRYSFVDPASALAEPLALFEVYQRYETPFGFDVQGFLKTVHGLGIVQSFQNAVHRAGCRLAEPFEQLRFDGVLDLERIRAGEPKYLLREVFRERFPGLEIPEKIAFARPMDRWLADWSGPKRHEFRDDLDLDAFSGDQRWLLWCLERFLHLADRS